MQYIGMKFPVHRMKCAVLKKYVCSVGGVVCSTGNVVFSVEDLVCSVEDVVCSILG